MRPIKFRAWLKDEKKMYEWHREFFYDTSPVTNYNGDFPEDENMAILMQFTGLLDKNGNDIYEGDIIQYKNNNYEIVYLHDAFYIKTHNPTEEARKVLPNWDFFGDRLYYYAASSEVIGNIHQNPELLKA